MLALKTLDCLTVAIFQISPLLLYVGVPFGSLHLTNSAQYDSYGRTWQSLHVKSSGALSSSLTTTISGAGLAS
jgi:hypothetical protein